jgi:peptidyl-prolyl cis-trans isomerase SurA
MKKIVLLLILIVCFSVIYAKDKNDPIIMTIGNKEIPVSEFLYFAKKDNSVDIKDKKSVENYIELFKNYKLKVVDAESLTINKAPKFEQELDKYRKQLEESFLFDKQSEDSAVYKIYERTKYIPGFRHIFFRLPGGYIFPKDTVEIYNEAMTAYNRIVNGESMDSVGNSLKEQSPSVYFEKVDYAYPLTYLKAIENPVFTMEPGEISKPVRSMYGYHIFNLLRKIPNPGKVRVAHILSSIPTENPTDSAIASALKKSDVIYKRAISGDDFAELAKEFSDDSLNRNNGGLLPYFGLGEMIEPFEKTAFAFDSIGEISEPVKTKYGYHVLKLIDKKSEISFEEQEISIYEAMKFTERNFELYKGFVDKMKLKHGYKFYPEAYKEMEELAGKYFPSDTSFYDRVIKLTKPLITLDSIDFTQQNFATFIYNTPTSAKTLSTDFMSEVFELFIRDIVTELERRTLVNNKEFELIMNEYYDGILLFEISNVRVWGHPAEDQDKLEKEWVKEINEKYPVKIDRKVVKKLKEYMN